MAPFLSNSEFLTRYDFRVVGQLVSDTGSQTDEEELSDDENLATALADASGEILMSALRGGRYTEADLNNLTDNSLAYLQRLTADLAIYFLVLRRGLDVEEYPQTVRAVEALERIAKGELVFNVQSTIDAGVAASPEISFTTIVQNNWLRDAVKAFPVRRFTQNQN